MLVGTNYNTDMSYTLTPPTYSNVTITAMPYTVGTGITITDPTWSTSATWNAPSSGRMVLKGEDADIEINGRSLNETLQAIKDQLLIPTVVTRDPKLEAEFEELRTLGERYQNLLEHYREQMRVFETLKKQDL